MKLIIFFLIIFIFIMCGCSNQTKVNDIQTQTVSCWTDYGNGVYYFPCRTARDEDFGGILSNFIGQHSELELVSMSSLVRYKTKGYFIVFRSKK